MNIGNLILNKKIKLVQLADIIINQLHIRRNDVVMLNVSFQQFNLVDASPEDLFHLLKMIIGTQGALLVPMLASDQAISKSSGISGERVNAFSTDDISNEIIKQMPYTIRHNMPSGSLAAWGNIAKRFAEGSPDNDLKPENSELFYKLVQLQAKIVGLGVPLAQNSFASLSEASISAGKSSRDINSLSERYTGNYQEIFNNILSSKSQNEISALFSEEEVSVFSRGGIPFFRIDTEKFFSKAILLPEIKKQTA